jgi:hypothetical protein
MDRKGVELDRKGMVHCAFVPVPEGISNGLEYLLADQRREQEEEMLGKGKGGRQGGRLTLVDSIVSLR